MRNRTRAGSWVKRLGLVLPLICLAAVAYWRQGRSQPAHPNPPSAPAVAVVATPARIADLPVYRTGIGSVAPLQTVTVRTRVDGELMRVLFREGEEVHKGQLLAVVDPRPFQVQLEQAEGQLARDIALQGNAHRDLQRYVTLLPHEAIPQQQLATQQTLVSQYVGIVKSDRGLVDSAKLQLRYCHITSPLAGRVGLRLVDPGNIVHAADANGFAVITQLDPIAVIFTLPEDSLPEVLAAQRRGSPLAVTALDRALQRTLASGSLLAVDNQVDPGTGTVRLKAVFPNRDRTLFPNQFVNARLLVGSLRDTVVPASAIQRGPQGPFVYLLTPENTAEVRPVAVEETQGDEVAVKRGLSVGDRVVTQGSERLRPGAKVTVSNGDASHTGNLGHPAPSRGEPVKQP